MTLIGIATLQYNINNIPNMRLPDKYYKVIHQCGGYPLGIPVINDEAYINRVLDTIDGLVIPGGGDVHPKFYNEPMTDLVMDVDETVDQFHINLILKALERKMPILAICRGHQVLNVALGGSLYQDLSLFNGNNVLLHDQTKIGIPYHETLHEVTFEDGSILASLFGRKMHVNSFHHQAIKDLGKGLKTVAYTSDGVIEAVELEGRKDVISVQWHPERTENQIPLIKYFLNIVRERKE